MLKGEVDEDISSPAHSASHTTTIFVSTKQPLHLEVENKIRYVFVVVIALLWVFLVIDTIVVFAAAPEVSTMLVKQKIFNLFLLVVLPFGLVRAHREKVVSLGTIEFLIHCFGISLNGAAFQVYPTRPTLFQIMLVLASFAIMNLPHWKLQCLTLLPGLIVNSYNATFGLNGYSMLLFVDVESGLFREIAAHLKVVVLLPICLFMVRTVTVAYYESASRMEVALVVAKQVSEHLAEYNTQSAETTLLQYSTTKECDKDLHAVLLVIVDNLKKYKPYLPNYMVNCEESPSQPANVPSSADCTTSPLSPPTPPTPPTPPSAAPRVSKTVRLLAMVPTQRTLSYGLVDFLFHNDDVMDNPQPLRSFIDRVYRYADLCRGAVHSCVGDTVHVTWNTVTPVSGFQQSCVGLLRMLKNSSGTDLTLSSRVEVCGSVMTGIGECRITGTVHQTFLLHIDWREEQLELHRYARMVKTNVMCSETARNIKEPTMLVDVLSAYVIEDKSTVESLRKSKFTN
eukprot:PhF_6_TR21216/c0_g1_i2/m.30643